MNLDFVRGSDTSYIGSDVAEAFHAQTSKISGSSSSLTMSPAYIIGPEAYYKIFFHATKHPHKSVNGVLLGTQDSQHPGRAVEIADSVPLLHHWTSLSPMMEIGLDLVRSFLHSTIAVLNKSFYVSRHFSTRNLLE